MRLVIADDHAILRQGLVTILKDKPEVDLIREADNGVEACKLARDLHPDIAIMDISMPNLNGIDAAKQILSNDPQAKVIILSIHTRQNLVSDALKAGCLGFVSKKSMLEEIVHAIDVVSQGNHYLSPDVSRVVIDEFSSSDRKDAGNNHSELTMRERQILQLVAEGQSTKQIALQLHVSPKTVDAARRRIMDKTNMRSVAELTKYAINEGLTSLEF